MNKFKNPNCDKDKCFNPHGEVRLYPLGGGGNLILCFHCWADENLYRYERAKETKQPENWPQVNWFTAEIYGEHEPYFAEVAASKAGSIGTKYNIHRNYRLEARSLEEAQDLAIQAAHNEGLEHVLVTTSYKIISGE